MHRECTNPICHLRSSVLKTVLEAKHQLCPKTVTREYLVNPSDLQYPPRETSKTTLYNLPRAAEALLTSQPNTVDQYGKKFIGLDTLLSFEPLNCLGLREDVLRELFDTQHPSDSRLKEFLSRVSPQSTQPEIQQPVQKEFVLSPQTVNEIFQAAKSGVRFVQKLFEAWFPYQQPTFQEVLHELVNQYSVLCGRNLLVRVYLT